MPNDCRVPLYAAHAAQNGSGACRPGTPVGSGLAVTGTDAAVKPGGGIDVVAAGCATPEVAGEPAQPAALNSATTTNHDRVLDATRSMVILASSVVMASDSTLLPIILDCDPGHDDAIAMVVAARHTDLLGITTVAGNAPLESTTVNAIVIRDLLGIDVAVHAGANRPLVAPARHADYIHGKSGLDGADLPAPSGPPASRDAVGFIIETVRERDGVWLVPTGPLTNIALALRSAPDIAGRIAGISLMGGGLFGNSTPVAEFNLWADPEAAAMVFAYGGPLIMAGLDLTHQFQATSERIDMVRALPGSLASVLADLLVFFSESYVRRHGDMSGAAVHDPCAVMALTHPQLFTRTFSHVEIETSGEHTQGMTVIDQRNLIEPLAPNCDRLTGLDATAAWEVITEAIAHFSR
jgi:inosine-uridine nucleoside N-ribohydrolase